MDRGIECLLPWGLLVGSKNQCSTIRSEGTFGKHYIGYPRDVPLAHENRKSGDNYSTIDGSGNRMLSPVGTFGR
jgi:hypothetical protein